MVVLLVHVSQALWRRVQPQRHVRQLAAWHHPRHVSLPSSANPCACAGMGCLHNKPVVPVQMLPALPCHQTRGVVEQRRMRKQGACSCSSGQLSLLCSLSLL